MEVIKILNTYRSSSCLFETPFGVIVSKFLNLVEDRKQSFVVMFCGMNALRWPPLLYFQRCAVTVDYKLIVFIDFLICARVPLVSVTFTL